MKDPDSGDHRPQSQVEGSKTCTELSRSIKNLKRLGLSVIALMLAVFGAVAQAQQPKKAPLIGVLAGGRGLGAAGEAFRAGLRDFGWIDGKNVGIELRLGELELGKLPQLTSELVRLKVAAIVADGDPAIRAAKQATNTIPIVVIAVGDPVKEGLVASLARPGGNITGLTSISAELTGKRLELIKEIVSKSFRMAVLWNPANASNVLEFKETEVAAQTLGLNVQSLEVRGPDDFQPVFSSAVRNRANALIILRDPVVDSHHFQILDFAVGNRLPSIYGEEQFVEAAGLMSYGPSRVQLFRRAATYVDKILRGAKPADLPVQQPTKFELAINLKTAKQIGLTIPPNVLARADKVIK